MIVVGSCYFLLTLLIPYDPNIDFVFPLSNCSVVKWFRVRVGRYYNEKILYIGDA